MQCVSVIFTGSFFLLLGVVNLLDARVPIDRRKCMRLNTSHAGLEG